MFEYVWICLNIFVYIWICLCYYTKYLPKKSEGSSAEDEFFIRAQSSLFQFFQVLLRNCCQVEQNKWLSCDVPPLPPLRLTGLLLPSPAGPELNRNRHHTRGCEFCVAYKRFQNCAAGMKMKWVQCHPRWKNIRVFQNTDALPSVVFKITDKFGFGK